MLVFAGSTRTTDQAVARALLAEHQRVRVGMRRAAVVAAWRQRGARLAQVALRVRADSRPLFSFLLASFVVACGGGGSALAFAAPAPEMAAGMGSQPHGVAVSNDEPDDPASRAEIAVILKSIGAATSRFDTESASAAHAKEVIDWNAFASNLAAANLPPGPQTYVLAITHIAIHDALNAVEPKYTPYAYAGSAPGASVAAAVAAAARDALAGLVPQAASAIDAEYAAALSSIPHGAARDAGVAAGQAAAAVILDLRTSDDLNAVITKPYLPGTPAPGVYQPTPPLNFVLLAGWSELRPFALATARQFRSPPPFPVKSLGYTRDYKEVKSIGSTDSTTRSARQSETAQFWYDAATKEWHVAARKGLADVGADAWRAARTLAVLSIAMADAVIATFASKFEYEYWRPITAIRAGGNDGNPATAGDPAWEPFCVTPPFPEYNSTHAATAAAAAVALGRQLGDRHIFTVDSPTLRGISRTYRRFSAAAYEEGISRIYCGIHFRHAMNAGFAQGALVADFVDRKLLQRLD